MKTSKFWENNNYYLTAKKAILSTDHYGMRLLRKYCLKKSSILDVGCGDGTRLAILPGINKIGVDISKTAISLAIKRYPKIKFIKSNIEKLPFKNNLFNISYSAFVLEHLHNPEKVVTEIIRVTKKRGRIILIAPNYGAPNRASPVFRGSRFIKLIHGLLLDITANYGNKEKLNWEPVRADKNIKKYFQDVDTLVEPYLGSLVKYLSNKVKIIEYNTCWEEELPDAKLMQKFFRILGEKGIFPFNFWGPHLVLVAEK